MTRLCLLTAFVSASCATAVLPVAASDCLRDFNHTFERLDAPSRHRFIEHLELADMECLFTASKSAVAFDESFIASPGGLARQKLQRFSGINSLAVGRRFEKHLVRLSTGEWYGYNASSIGRTLASPGFFHVRFTGDGSAVFDYSGDFVGDLERQGLTEALLATPGLEARGVQNNTGNLLFHDLVDTLRRVNADVAVGTAERITGERRTLLSYFMIYRSPSPPPTGFQTDDGLTWSQAR